MRSLLTGLSTLALGLATCLSAMAQTATQNPNQGQNQSSSNQNRQGDRKAIQGVISAVTVEGELMIDQRTNRAASAEMTFLTIVGSERPRDRQRDAAQNRDGNQNDRNDRDAARNRDGDQNDRNARNAGDRQASSDGQRHNVYVVWLTPRTEIRRLDRDRDNQDANRNERDRGDRNTGANANASNRGVNANALTLDALEVGDRVEVQFIERGAADNNQNRNQAQNQNPNAASRKHGRHRTYYGEAVAINILSSPDQNDRDRDSDRDQNRDRNRDQNNRNNDRNDNRNQ
jgi:hypothetical protein